MAAKVYADFQNLDDSNRLRLVTNGTQKDLDRQSIELREGLVLTFYMDDSDEQGRPDELRAEGTVQFNSDENCWVAAIDWNAIRHASDDVPRGMMPPQPGIASPEGIPNRIV